jgi:hypothetical protein
MSAQKIYNKIFEENLEKAINRNLKETVEVYQKLREKYNAIEPGSTRNGALIEAATLVDMDDVNIYINLKDKMYAQFDPKNHEEHAALIRGAAHIYFKSNLQAIADSFMKALPNSGGKDKP